MLRKPKSLQKKRPLWKRLLGIEESLKVKNTYKVKLKHSYWPKGRSEFIPMERLEMKGTL